MKPVVPDTHIGCVCVLSIVRNFHATDMWQVGLCYEIVSMVSVTNSQDNLHSLPVERPIVFKINAFTIEGCKSSETCVQYYNSHTIYSIHYWLIVYVVSNKLK